MTLDEIVAKAKYIQFPYANQEYRDYYEKINPIKLPIIPDKEVLYVNMPKSNNHHYTTEYTYKYVLPILDNLFHFSYSLDDFNLVENKNELYDLSYIVPKEKERYKIIDYIENETYSGDYMILFHPTFFTTPLYRELYRFPHSCSRVINETTKSNRKLMISGDSQMIPSLAPLAHYFKEVWYFDNRTGYVKDPELKQLVFKEDLFKSYSKTYKDIQFTDVLIECYCRDLKWYEYWNLQ